MMISGDARDLTVVGSIPIKGSRCFLKQDILTSLPSTGLFQERIRVCFPDRT